MDTLAAKRIDVSIDTVSFIGTYINSDISIGAYNKINVSKDTIGSIDTDIIKHEFRYYTIYSDVPKDR